MTSFTVEATDAAWKNIQKIADEYTLGKNQRGKGRFTGKDIELQLDGSIKINQEFYIKDRVHDIPLPKKRKQQRFSKYTPTELEQLRSSLGLLSWLSKETRCDLAGRVALLQQAFPEPKVMDLTEANKISHEARKHAHIGIKVMPIPLHNLRVSLVTDAAWGNTKDRAWIEDSPEDYWEEQSNYWVRHHVKPRRTTFHPGAAQGGPDLHAIMTKRTTQKFDLDKDKLAENVIEDDWTDNHGVRVLQDAPWTGATKFAKNPDNKLDAKKVHTSLAQLEPQQPRRPDRDLPRQVSFRERTASVNHGGSVEELPS